jgi:hypothetical protein
MKKFLAIFAVLTLVVGVSPASAKAKISISPQNKVSKKNPVITIKVSGLPADHGIYISQCMAPSKKAGEAKSCNPAETSKLWVSDVAKDQAMGAKASTAKLQIKVDKYFEGGDCIHTTCVLLVTNDHSAADDRSEDQTIKFKFAGINLF